MYLLFITYLLKSVKNALDGYVSTYVCISFSFRKALKRTALFPYCWMTQPFKFNPTVRIGIAARDLFRLCTFTFTARPIPYLKLRNQVKCWRNKVSETRRHCGVPTIKYVWQSDGGNSHRSVYLRIDVRRSFTFTAEGRKSERNVYTYTYISREQHRPQEKDVPVR